MRKAMLRTCLFLVFLTANVIAQNELATDIESVLEKGLTVRWRDDAIGHPDLIVFRDQLKKAAREHDAQVILKAAAPDFRGCDMRGIDDLRKFLEEPIWSDFYKSLREGGILSPDGRSFDSNYAVWTFPRHRVGLFGPENFRVINSINVSVLEHPNPRSRILGSLSYNLVIPEESLVENGWQRVEFRRGQYGFIDSKYLIDPIGMSVRMRRLGDRWRLVGIATYCD
jgi:hypothetical protein